MASIASIARHKKEMEVGVFLGNYSPYSKSKNDANDAAAAASITEQRSSGEKDHSDSAVQRRYQSWNDGAVSFGRGIYQKTTKRLEIRRNWSDSMKAKRRRGDTISSWNIQAPRQWRSRAEKANSIFWGGWTTPWWWNAMSGTVASKMNSPLCLRSLHLLLYDQR